jgi:hypothetical protein
VRYLSDEDRCKYFSPLLNRRCKSKAGAFGYCIVHWWKVHKDELGKNTIEKE